MTPELLVTLFNQVNFWKAVVLYVYKEILYISAITVQENKKT